MEVVTPKGKIIKNMPINYASFLNLTTILYGPSKSGKSVLIVDILYHLRNHVPMVFCVSPTEPQNNTFKGIIPTAAVRVNTDPETLIPFLQELWSRQEIATAMYKKATDIEILEKLYKRVRTPDTDFKLKKINAVFDKTTSEINEKLEALKSAQSTAAVAKQRENLLRERDKIKEEIKKLKITFFRSAIKDHKMSLMRDPSLSDDERYSLRYLKMNPNVVIIFDDCASQIKKIQGTALFKNYVYMNRHVNVTTIIAAQDDTNIDTDIRKNAFQSIFCTAQVAHGYFNRGSNDFSREERKEIESINHTIFTNADHKKLVYSRGSEDSVKYVEATKHLDSFSVGSDAFWEYCSKVEADSASISKENSFYDLFAQ